MRLEAEQAAKALKEQSRAMKDMTTAVASTAREIKLISHANREHSTVAGTLLGEVAEIRKITDRNARGVKETRVSTARSAPAYRSAQRDRRPRARDARARTAAAQGDTAVDGPLRNRRPSRCRSAC